MRAFVLFVLLTGCDVVFRIDRVGPGPDAGLGTAHGDSGDDSATANVDAAVDAPSDPNDMIDFAGFPVAYICYGDQVTTTLRLWRDPGASVSVTVTSANPTYVTVSPSTYTFDSTNWSTTQNVTVTGAMPTSTPVTITAASAPYYDKTDTLYVRSSGGFCL